MWRSHRSNDKGSSLLGFDAVCTGFNISKELAVCIFRAIWFNSSEDGYSKPLQNVCTFYTAFVRKFINIILYPPPQNVTNPTIRPFCTTHSMEQSSSLYVNSFSPSQDILRILRNQKVYDHVHKNALLSPILSRINPVHSLPLYFFRFYYFIFLSCLYTNIFWALRC